MNFFCLGVDFRKAPLELRGRASQKAREVLHSLGCETKEKLLLSTCNRVEIYGLGSEDTALILERWLKLAEIPTEERSVFQIKTGRSALEHLFRVTAGMESMVVGENQILGQVKRAYDQSAQSQDLGPFFHRAFQWAFKVAKKIRTRTEVGRLSVSIPSIGVKLAEKVLGSLATKKVLILGLGEIGRISAEHFASVQPKKLWLYNRTQKTAESFASKLRDEQIAAEVVLDFKTVLDQVDVVVSAIDAVLLKKEELKILDARALPLLVLDLSVPASVEATTLTNVFCYSIDDLQKIAEENSSLRRQELEKAEAIIEEEAQALWQTQESATIHQTFGRLQSKLEILTQSELRFLRQRLPDLSDVQWKEIEGMARRLSAKVLHDPMIELKSQMVEENADAEAFVKFFKNLFRI